MLQVQENAIAAAPASSGAAYRPAPVRRLAPASPWTAAKWSEIAPLERDWRALEACAAGTMFQSYDWCRAWIEASAARRARESVRVLTVADGTGIALIWPLAIRRVMGRRVLGTLGEPASQYSGVLISPNGDPARLLSLALGEIRSWSDVDVLQLRRVPDDSPLGRCPDLTPHAAPGTREAAPFVDFSLHGSADATGQRSSRSRNALRRHEKQLATEGPVGFRIIETGDAEAQVEAFAAAIRLKEAWLREKGAVKSGASHLTAELALMRFAREGRLCGAVLTVGDQVGAVELGVQRRGIYYSLVQSYQLRLSRHSPGRLLFWHLLRNVSPLGITLFDFLAPATKHKLEWSNGSAAIRDYVVPLSRSGRIAAWYLSAVRPRLRDGFRGLPPVLRVVLGRLRG